MRTLLDQAVDNLPSIKSKHIKDAQKVKLAMNQTRQGAGFKSVQTVCTLAPKKAQSTKHAAGGPEALPGQTSMSTSNKGLIGGQASYFHHPTDNMFNPMKHMGVGVKEEIRAFHLTQPDQRLSKALFSQ